MAFDWRMGLLAAAAVAATVMSGGAAAPAAGAAASGAAGAGAAAGGAAAAGAGTAAAGTAAAGTAAAGATAAGTTAASTAGMTAAEIAAAEAAATAAAAEGATAGVAAAEGAAAAEGVAASEAVQAGTAVSEAAQAGTTASEVAQTSQATNIGYGSETGYSSAFQPSGATPTPTGNEGGALSNTMGDATALPETGNVAAEQAGNTAADQAATNATTEQISPVGTQGTEQAGVPQGEGALNQTPTEEPSAWQKTKDWWNQKSYEAENFFDGPSDETIGKLADSTSETEFQKVLADSSFDKEKYAKLAAALKTVSDQSKPKNQTINQARPGAVKSQVSGPLNEQLARNRQQLYSGQWGRKFRNY